MKQKLILRIWKDNIIYDNNITYNIRIRLINDYNMNYYK